MSTLYQRLTLVVVVILLLLGGFCLWLTHRSAEIYFLEFTQRLNAPIAMYMAQRGLLLDNDAIDKAALAEMAEHIMMINPSVELYVLDTHGKVIGQATEANTIASTRVSLEPIHRFLDEGDVRFPLYGDDPGDSRQSRVFSAFPLKADGLRMGYVYAVLAGKQHESMLRAIQTSYSLRNLLLVLLGVVALASLSAGLIFFMLTRRLRALTDAVRQWQRRLPGAPGSESIDASTAQQYNANSRFLDEIDELKNAYEGMASRLWNQYAALEASDTERRELIACVSHDLRTPLTTLKGYLETLRSGLDAPDDGALHRNLDVAFSQCLRLQALITQLFELSTLNARTPQLSCERFPLLELAHDMQQSFANRAEQRDIALTVVPFGMTDQRFHLEADIALMHRLFENLLDNALRYTPRGGRVEIRLERLHRDHVELTIQDSGIGLVGDDCNRVFEPGYTAHSRGNTDIKHGGIGLAIVHRIVELHGGDIEVTSSPGAGTEFRIKLPVLEPAPVISPYCALASP